MIDITDLITITSIVSLLVLIILQEVRINRVAKKIHAVKRPLDQNLDNKLELNSYKPSQPVFVVNRVEGTITSIKKRTIVQKELDEQLKRLPEGFEKEYRELSNERA